MTKADFKRTPGDRPGRPGWPAPRLRLLLALLFTLLLSWLLAAPPLAAAPPQFPAVVPGKPLTFPRDFGAHPDFRTEWWYVTGWLHTPEQKPIGFQLTFFRVSTTHDRNNPSRFAPKEILIGHAALSQPEHGKLLHDQKSARTGFGLSYAKPGTTDVKLDRWHLKRNPDGQYQAEIPAAGFTLSLSLTPTQPPLVQGEQGYFRKGPRPEQASYYYSEPQLRVSGSIARNGKTSVVSGTAWLDHEWFSEGLDPDASGWDWVGANLDDGSAIMALQIRSKSGEPFWAHATLREASGKIRHFGADQVRFIPLRHWRSPRTNASYPVAMRVSAGDFEWELVPLQDDQELDSRATTGIVYWEGAVTLLRDKEVVGRGYLEMTGYLEQLKL